MTYNIATGHYTTPLPTTRYPTLPTLHFTPCTPIPPPTFTPHYLHTAPHAACTCTTHTHGPCPHACHTTTCPIAPPTHAHLGTTPGHTLPRLPRPLLLFLLVAGHMTTFVYLLQLCLPSALLGCSQRLYIPTHHLPSWTFPHTGPPGLCPPSLVPGHGLGSPLPASPIPFLTPCQLPLDG